MSIGQLRIRGVIRGRTIELDSAPDLPSGQTVVVKVSPAVPPGTGLRNAAGGWSDAGDELDEWLRGLRRDRDDDRPASET